MSERIRLAVVGAAQGLAVWLLLEGWPEAHAARAVCVGLLTSLAVSTLVFHFAWTADGTGRLLRLAAATGLLYGLVATWVGFTMPEQGAVSGAGDDRVVTWVLASFVTLYVLGPFLQIHQRTGRLVFPYDQLFLHAWNNFFVALVAALFTAALWTVLLLWAELFELIGIGFFGRVFEEGVFAWQVTGAAAGYGIAFGRESESVVATLRRVTLAVFTGPLPLVCFVALLFLATLPFTGLDPLWETDRASYILLAWVAVTVLFFNAVYQEGRRPPALPAPARRVVELGLVAMSGFLAISAWGLWLRVQQHGLTPTRLWGLLWWAVLAAFAVGYAGAVARRGDPWLPAVQRVNRAVAWLVVALGLLAHTPLLDPIGWSARSQYDRLAGGRVAAAQFDYGYLRFELGQEGAERFERLASLEAHPEIEAIRAGLARARAATSYWEWKQEQKSSPELLGLEVLPAGAEVPAGLADAIRGELHRVRCDAERACTVFAAEVQAGPPEEWILAAGPGRWPSLYVFARDDAGSFVYRGRLDAAGDAPEAVDLGSALRGGQVQSVPSPWRDLVIQGSRYGFVPTR